MRYLSIKNFSKHQHYKDRRPPWIKLHAEVLDDYDFLCLQDASKAHLMLLWVLASKLDNRIPYDLAFIAKKLGTTSPVDVEELVLQGFIEVSQDDSKPLARRKQSAMPETETETERETEGARRTARGLGRDEITVRDHYLSRHPRRKLTDAVVRKHVTPMLKHFTADELCRAIDVNADDDWHRERKKHELSYVLRGVEMVSGWLDRAPEGPQVVGAGGNEDEIRLLFGGAA